MPTDLIFVEQEERTEDTAFEQLVKNELEDAFHVEL